MREEADAVPCPLTHILSSGLQIRPFEIPPRIQLPFEVGIKKLNSWRGTARGAILASSAKTRCILAGAAGAFLVAMQCEVHRC